MRLPFLRRPLRPLRPLRRASGTRRWRLREEGGQVLLVFAVASTVLLGAAAIVTDVSWLWVNRQRMQRAADAAALAGAIHLPGDPATAIAVARAEARRNGYVHGSGGVVIDAIRDPSNLRRLRVTLRAEVGTHFARVFCVQNGPCLDNVDITVRSAAEYTLPVPMGSPQSFFGVGYLMDRTTSPATSTGSTGWDLTKLARSGGSWTSPTNAYTANNVYATVAATGSAQTWTDFGLLTTSGAPPDDPSVVVDGIQLRLQNTSLAGSGTATGCRIAAELSWDGGTTWSTPQLSSTLTTSTTADPLVGTATGMSGWGARTWTRADLGNGKFVVRLTWTDGTATCATTQSARLDAVEVQVAYRYSAPTRAWANRPVVAPDGTTLAAQNFWAAMQSQGAPSHQGDIFLTGYDTRTSVANAHYAPLEQYQYAITVPAGATNGEVWLFDPGMCETGTANGLGENWTVGGSTGYATRQPASAFFDLWDTRETPWETGDDVLVASSGNTFRRQLNFSAWTAALPSGMNDCSGMSWHLGWWRLASGLIGGAAGRTYRLHTYTSDPTAPADQVNTTALNAFAVWTRAIGGNPRIAGIGAMEAYVRLPASTTSEFYLAQIDAVHAGKTLAIDLWDPGDTGSLAARLEILRPTGTGYAVTPFSWTAERVSSAGSSCAGLAGTNVTSVTTNTGGTSLFNGCWLRVTVAIPNDYDAPLPITDTTASDGGWWKIRYAMGSGSGNATDLTTWTVAVRGSPVHLVP